MKYIMISIFSLFFLSSIHSEILNDYQDIRKGVLEKNLIELKKPEFQKDILPHDFTYFIDLLQYGKKTEQERTYAYSLVRLFSNILKGAEYVNADKFSTTLLKPLPDALKDYFITTKMETYFSNKTLYDAETLDRFKEVVNTMLYTRFSTEFEVFKRSPGEFLDILSDEITHVVEEEMSIEQLRQSFIRFLEIGLSKLVWSPEDGEKTWNSVKDISYQLATLVDNNILVDINDLDDLFWTLTYRYCYFLEIAGSDLPLEFFEKVKNDITAQELLFLELEEEDNLFESKASYLTRSLFQAEVKSRAYKKGIVLS